MYARKIYEKCIEVFLTHMTLLLTAPESEHLTEIKQKQAQTKLGIKIVIGIRMLLLAIVTLSIIYSKIQEDDLVIEVLVLGEWFVNSSSR